MAKRQTQSANLSRSEWMLRRLAEEGLRSTNQRTVVVQAIVDKRGAFTSEGLVDELRSRGVSRATVYRSIEVLERLGLLTRMHLDGCRGYTLCEEGHHHHLMCGGCGAIVPVDATRVEAEIRKLADDLRFRVDTHTLEFAGRCEACLKRDATSGQRAAGSHELPLVPS